MNATNCNEKEYSNQTRHFGGYISLRKKNEAHNTTVNQEPSILDSEASTTMFIYPS